MSHARPEPHIPSTASGRVPTPRDSGQGHEGTERLHGPEEEAPPGARHLPSLAAMLLFGLLCLGGFGFTLMNFAGAMLVFPIEAVVAALLLTLLGVLGFWVLRRIRPVRPPSLTFSFLALLWGMTGAVGLALFANSNLLSAWSRAGGLEFGTAWGAALTAPVNEELLKVLGVVLIAVVAPRVVRGPVDGFVIGSLVGLGFQLVENFTYALNAISMGGGTGGMASVLETLFVRVGLTGLGSHWAMSALAGTAIGLLAATAWRPGGRRAAGAALLLLSAMGLHWLFDAPIADHLVGMAAKTLLVFLTAVTVYFAVRHTYRRRVRQDLAAQGEELGIRRSSAMALANRHGRRRELGHVAHPERPAVRARQEKMVTLAEDRAAEDQP